MTQETRYIEGMSGLHHYTILSERDLKELSKHGIICISLDRDNSRYIITEECWNAHFKED